MSFLEILSRLFYIGLGAFMGVCAYYICPLQSDVGSGWSDWLIFVLGGFYKLISWDFGVVFEQIAVQNEGA